MTKTTLFTKTLGTAALLLGIAGFASESQAVLVDCPASFTTDGSARVMHDDSADTAVSACQYVDPPDESNFANESNINAAGFLGFNDWEVIQGQIDANSSSGSWSIPGADFASLDYIIVFKDGEGTNLVGFLLNGEVSFGDWNTPFTDPPFVLSGESEGHDVSHYTIAQRGDEAPPTDVPEPATLGLIGLGLVGLGVMQRRRKVTH